MTNFEKIKVMSIDEIAALLSVEINPCKNMECDEQGDCKSCMKKWLESECDIDV